MVSSFKKLPPIGGHCFVVSVIARTRYAVDFVGKIMEFFAVPSVTKIEKKCFDMDAVELSNMKSMAAPLGGFVKEKLHKISWIYV